MPNVPTLAFSDGRRIPQFGLGVFQTPADETAQVVATAFGLGYRHIDTAAIYRNESGVGQAIAGSGIPRDELFITTKLWNADQGYDSALHALDSSLLKLKLDYVDLYLIHWPCPANGRFVDSWKALIQAQKDGKAKSIGVSNFRIADLERIVGETGVAPVANQIELHPLFQQAELREYHARHGIVTESWSPLARGGELLGDATLQAIAGKHGKSVAQVVLRWHVQLGLVVFPKSVTPSRIKENIEIFDFELDGDDLAAIAGLDRGQRIGPDPATLN
ncbi:aldo/keto reductase [Pseudoxanthomonas sangjuensis]|uniref:aldo/keto reductase n=1 Tax=Pseudoxanthomonas sangjuensis TaxID=1503750 RepID=UPI001390BB8A|nr:aldo/keto reductase [Pseudoxanthomonas sangjuensis]KAF1711021.1 oxidoreductase [Pseudoxanthomonas sangjuensis]